MSIGKVLDASVAKQLANFFLIGRRDLGGTSQLELPQSSRGVVVLTTEGASVPDIRIETKTFPNF